MSNTVRSKVVVNKRDVREPLPTSQVVNGVRHSATETPDVNQIVNGRLVRMSPDTPAESVVNVVKHTAGK